MLMEETLAMVQDRLREVKGLRALLVLDQAQCDEVIEKERQAEEDARRSGPIKVVNEGFWTTFGREFQIALVLDLTSPIIHRTDLLLQLRDQEGRKIGEGVNRETVQGRSGDQAVRYISKDFVLYEGVKVKGEPYFVIPEVEFDLLQGVKGIQKIISCSPSAQVDAVIREWSGLDDEGLFTRIVGFDMDRDDLD